MNNNGNYNTTIDARATTNSLKYVCKKQSSCIYFIQRPAIFTDQTLALS